MSRDVLYGQNRLRRPRNSRRSHHRHSSRPLYGIVDI